MKTQSQKNYENATEAYQNALKDYKETASKEYEQAYSGATPYTGDEGYKRSLELSKDYAQQLAGSAAGQAQSQGTAASRAQGMSKSQAAMLGAQQSANAYGNAFNTQLAQQQNAAYQSGLDRANAGFQKAGGISETYGNAVSGQGNLMASQQAERLNQYNRTWGTIGGIGSLLLSDERAKDYVPTDEMIKYLQTHGLSRGKDNREFDPVQLATGILVEQEHADNFEVALEIAKDHLVEDPQYYAHGRMPVEAVKTITASVLKYKVDVEHIKEI